MVQTIALKQIAFIFLLHLLCFASQAQSYPSHHLIADTLPKSWDEAMPQGNGMLGALIWQHENKLRLSLDRADLWDERTAMDISKFNFKFVQEHVANKNYDTVHQLGDWPYDNIPYPTKLPGAAIQFDLAKLGTVKKVSLYISSALCTVDFESGIRFNSYIHATDNTGYFGFENVEDTLLIPELIVPDYVQHANSDNKNVVYGQGLSSLGYTAGKMTTAGNTIRYHQPTCEGHYYEILVQWQTMHGNNIIGSWTISNDKPASLPFLNAALDEPTGWPSHEEWWKNFWQQSSVSLPDELLQRQYEMEMYKLGCVARKGAPAITLQAIWTADNGSLPPWKGDFHHDLNTQLSYWPCYTGNHLQEAETFTDWLWQITDANKKYTKQYFGVEGIAVPGVSTISGAPMGGWIQYSLSPSVSSWLAQHFYWQWKYSMDKKFLETKAYPYLQQVATFIENITYIKNGKRKVPLSSSPEYNDNNVNAWFTDYTNYDLSLYKFALYAAADASFAMNKKAEADHWKKIESELPAFDVNETGLTIAPGQNLDESHRHHAHLMPLYPLCQLNVDDAADKKIIDASLQHLAQKGTSQWCGYSFTWLACIYARAKQPDSALKQLKIFANNFCSSNSFHLNGDQKGGEYSSFTYRPFTLEGNFAFAQGVHEMLLQSKKNYIEVFPAVPREWKDVAFNQLRAEGAFLISAKKENGVADAVIVYADNDGKLRIKLPFKTMIVEKENPQMISHEANGMVSVIMKKGETIVFKNGYE